MKKLAITFYLIGVLLMTSGSMIGIKDEKTLIVAQEKYDSLFIDDSPKDNITQEDIDKFIPFINNISDYNKSEKSIMLDELKEYKKYFSLKKELLSKFTENAISLDLTNDNISEYEKRINKLSIKYKSKLTVYVTDMYSQRSNINNIETRIRELYYEGDLTNLKIEITREQIEAIKADLAKIPQKEYVNKKNELLDEAITTVNTREAINNAWVKLNVGYISQNQNNVLNGCEAATLLMALKYKGYLQDTNLYDYATNMPKSTNPYEGFTYDIYTREPLDVPHWIAPEPLAKYGRETSGNQNIVNGTGMSLNELDSELDNGNPVVIYLTNKFKTPKDWKEDAPTNLHVLLLVGYNKITGQHIVLDPWTRDDGRTSWTIYNAVGKRNVIVR